MRHRTVYPPRRSIYLLAFLASFVTACIIVYPEEAFRASLEGLRVWWEIVFPALLPFFIAAEILMALGVVHFMGTLLEPLMRPLFNVPGVGAFALAMGLASGYPMGAKITARLRRDNLCTQVEAERLLTFTNTADPLFMVGAVGVGMFGIEALGFTIAAAHYIASLILGLLMRLHAPSAHRGTLILGSRGRGNILDRAINELYRARQADGRSFGQVFGDSVRDSVSSLLLIGGTIIMFSVIIRVLTLAGVTKVIAGGLSLLLSPFEIHPSLVQAAVSGIFEITMGCEFASKATGSLLQRTTIASAIIAWSGLSVFAQVSSMVEGTDIRLGPYVVGRTIHGLLAAFVTLVLMGPLGQELGLLSIPVIPQRLAGLARPGFAACLLYTAAGGAFLLSGMLIASLLSGLISGIRVISFRVRR